MDLLTITPFQDFQLVFLKPQISSLFGRVAPTINDSHTGRGQVVILPLYLPNFPPKRRVFGANLY